MLKLLSTPINEGANDSVINFAQLTQRAGNFLVAREEMPDFKWEDLKGKISAWRSERCCSQINVNLESIVIICNWIDGLTKAKALHSAIL